MTRSDHATRVPEASLTVRIAQPRRATTIVRGSGKVNAATCPALRTAMFRALHLEPDTLTVDLTGVSSFSDDGVRALVALDTRCRAASVKLRLLPSPPVRSELDLHGLTTQFPAETRRVTPEATRGELSPAVSD